MNMMTTGPKPPIELLRVMAPGRLAKTYRELLAEQGQPHPDDMPDVYASTCVGRCMVPFYQDGDCIVFSRDERPAFGDCVGLWLAPLEVADGRSLRAVKRLASTLEVPFPLHFPYEVGGDVVPIVRFEQLNPPKSYAVPAHRIMAMHKVIGTAKPSGDGMAAFRRVPS